MNRHDLHNRKQRDHVPRVRGDEPFVIDERTSNSEMFPACAGMNRASTPRRHDTVDVPRVRGDEPNNWPSPLLAPKCSPRARG